MSLKSLLAIVYVVACLAVLDYAIAAHGRPDTNMVVAVVMLTLTFPVGCALGALMGGMAYALVRFFDVTLPMDAATNAVLIAIFAIAGYLQWFVALPRLWRASR